MHHRVWLRDWSCRRQWLTGLILLSFCVGWVPLRAQVSLKGQLSDFVFPNTDDEGRKTVLKGTAKTLPDGVIELSPMVAETYRGEELDMTIQAPHCLFNPRTKIAYSAGDLSVRTANERFAISGKGFRWQQTDSRLFISNQVHAVVRKALLDSQSIAPRAAASATAVPAVASPKGDTNSATETNQMDVIEIVSDRFDLQAALAQFRGNVKARQSEGKLDCGILRVHFREAGGQLDRVEAENNVQFERGDVQARGDRAVYAARDGQVSIHGNTAWRLADREGSSQVLHIDDKTRTLRAEREVRVALQPQKMLPLKWFSSSDPTNGPSQPPQPIAISADLLTYNPAAAVFSGNVRVEDSQGSSLSCGVMTNRFSANDGQLIEISAVENVEFRQGAAFARSERALYTAAANQVILTGQPVWRFAQGDGRSGRLVLHPDSQQIEADEQVTMRLLQADQALALDFPNPSGVSGPGQGGGATNAAPRYVEVSARELYYKPGSAIFLHQIRVVDPVATDRNLKCEVLAAFFGGGKNKLDQLIAEQNVEIQQGVTRAYGSKAVQWIPRGTIELTGDSRSGRPVLIGPERKFVADRFLFDRKNNQFRMIGHYQIEMARTAFRDQTSPEQEGGRP